MTAISAHVEIVRPPTAMVWAAGIALAASALLLVPRTLGTSSLGYMLAPIVVTVLVCVYRYRDARASQSPSYASQPRDMRMATWLVIASFAIGLAHAWIIATLVAKAISS